MDIKKLMGKRIQEIRKKKGFTQEQVAEKMDISSKYLSSIERGKENMTLNTILSLSDALDVPLNDFTNMLEIEETGNRRKLVDELLDGASDEQLKLVYKLLKVIIP